MKNLPLGISDFETIISENLYYVDKSLFIKELIDSWRKISLIPRPRRFGKTLNMSMLQYFFEKTEKSSAPLFKNLAVAQHPYCMEYQGQYPVIFLTFKSTDEPTWDECFNALQEIIAEEFKRHNYLLKSTTLDAHEKKEFKEIINLSAQSTAYKGSLKKLIKYLAQYHNKNVIVLIDEYDVPIQGGFGHQYYNKVIAFLKSFLGRGLKDNKLVEAGVVTGAMRVAKESIFTGLNNLRVCTIVDDDHADKFGLLEDEVHQILEHYNLAHMKDKIRSWYNGYSSGLYTIYNPWSIINFLEKKGKFKPYWINSSSNDIIKNLIQHSSPEVKEDFERLLKKESVQKAINENIVFAEIHKSPDALWNFLLFTGYLTFKNNPPIDEDLQYLELMIPNAEIEGFYKTTILGWFQQGPYSYNKMLQSLVSGDIETFSDLFTNFFLSSISYFDVGDDEPEKFYHAFVLGMFVSLEKDYELKSNHPSGYGRYDVSIIPRDMTKAGIIIEFKKPKKSSTETLEQVADNALQQIEEEKYATELKHRGISKIIKLGVAFQGKKVLVKEGK